MEIKIESKTAQAANADPGARINAGGTPYETTVWEGTITDDDLADADPFASVFRALNATNPFEAVFRAFNRVDDEDAERLAEWDYRLPSLSVGDRVTIDGETKVVAALGFEDAE